MKKNSIQKNEMARCTREIKGDTDVSVLTPEELVEVLALRACERELKTLDKLYEQILGTLVLRPTDIMRLEHRSDQTDTGSDMPQARDGGTVSAPTVKHSGSINRHVFRDVELRTVVDVFLEKMAVSIPCTASIVQLHNSQKGKMENFVFPARKKANWAGGLRKSYGTLCDFVFKTGLMLFRSDVGTGAHEKRDDDPHEPLSVSFLGIPLRVGTEIMGVLAVFTKDGWYWKDRELERVKTLAAQFSKVIRSFQNCQRLEENSKGPDRIGFPKKRPSRLRSAPNKVHTAAILRTYRQDEALPEGEGITWKTERNH